jgi:pimeloyl-ACP methyl ester carboxylesterase
MKGSCTVVGIPAGPVMLEGELTIPPHAAGLVLFAHGSGSGRHSPRNQFVAQVLQQAGVGTLLFDLLTADEEREDSRTALLRFDIPMLALRLVSATRAMADDGETCDLRPGFFGSSTGGAAALVAAAELGTRIGAVVSRGGRPDLAGDAMHRVTCPTLLIVGGDDHAVLGLNRVALRELGCEKQLHVVPHATHLFQEPGALEQVAALAAGWFTKHLHPVQP